VDNALFSKWSTTEIIVVQIPNSENEIRDATVKHRRSRMQLKEKLGIPDIKRLNVPKSDEIKELWKQNVYRENSSNSNTANNNIFCEILD